WASRSVRRSSSLRSGAASVRRSSRWIRPPPPRSPGHALRGVGVVPAVVDVTAIVGVGIILHIVDQAGRASVLAPAGARPSHVLEAGIAREVIGAAAAAAPGRCILAGLA